MSHKPREHFKSLIEEDFFIDNPNGTDIREELSDFLAAYDKLQSELEVVKAVRKIQDIRISTHETCMQQVEAEIEKKDAEIAARSAIQEQTIAMLDEERAKNAELEQKLKELTK